MTSNDFSMKIVYIRTMINFLFFFEEYNLVRCQSVSRYQNYTLIWFSKPDTYFFILFKIFEILLAA